jgi:hypothetical protein
LRFGVTLVTVTHTHPHTFSLTKNDCEKNSLKLRTNLKENKKLFIEINQAESCSVLFYFIGLQSFEYFFHEICLQQQDERFMGRNLVYESNL